MKRKAMLAMVLAVTLSTALLAGCGISKTGEEPAETEVAGEAVNNEHTVTFYDADGTTVLDTATVADGETVTETAPQKDGYTFIGWYVNPEKTRSYDFTSKVTDDVNLYAGFASYEEDTREFYIVGSGESDVLAESNWGAVTGDAQKFTKTENDKANEYTLTVTLAEGDQFQFAINGSWEDQRGYGYLATDSLDGTQYLKSAAGLGDSVPKKTNIEVAVAGTYTFTLTTYPAEDQYETEDPHYSEESKENFNINPYDTITWTYEAQ